MPTAHVHRISAAAPDDMSGIEAAIRTGRIDPKGVVAVLGKTEGNGLVNDFSRGQATTALNSLFRSHLPRDEADKICLVMSGGTEGAMAPEIPLTHQRPARYVFSRHVEQKLSEIRVREASSKASTTA